MTTRLHHVAITVSDVEESTGWYERAFGARVTRRTDVDDADIRGRRTRQVWLAVGEVVVNLAEGRPVRREADQHFVHYALGVDGDLDTWLGHFTDAGVPVVGTFGHGGLSFVSVYLDDPDGYRWELVVDYASYDAARSAALAHGGVLGNPMASYDWTE